MDDEIVAIGEWLDEKTQEILRKHFAKEIMHKDDHAKGIHEIPEVKPEFMRVKIGIDGDAQLDSNGMEIDIEARGRGKVSWKTLRNILIFSRSLKKLNHPAEN